MLNLISFLLTLATFILLCEKGHSLRQETWTLDWDPENHNPKNWDLKNQDLENQ